MKWSFKLIFGSHENFKSFYQGKLSFARVLREVRSRLTLFFLIQNSPGHEKITAKQRRCLASQCGASLSKAKAKILLEGLDMPGVLSFSIQDIGDTQEVSGRPDVNVDLFRGSRVGMPEAFGNKLYWDAFYKKRCCEIMPKSMRPKPRYPGIIGKFFTQVVHTAF